MNQDHQKNPKALRWFSLLVLPLAAIVACAPNVFAPWTLEIPKPNGKFSVGYTETTLTDPNRTMLVNGVAQPRIISLDIWYPASLTGAFEREPYSNAQLNAELHQHFGIPAFLQSVKPSWSYRNAPVLSGKHPVVIFNHAIGSFTRQNFSNLQALASQGMVVISIGHPGDSLLARDGTGQTIHLDQNNPLWQRWQAIQKDGKAVATEIAALMQAQRSATTLEQHQMASHQLAQHRQFMTFEPFVRTWLQDTQVVISALANASQPVLNSADASQITIMGHSLGGMVALEMARNPNPGIRAAIALDAPWVQYSKGFSRLKVPVLTFASTQNLFEGHDLGSHDCLNLPLSVSSGARIVEIAGTGHFSFTDLNYFPLFGRFSPILGSVDNNRMGVLLESALEEFLKRINTKLDLKPALFGKENGVKETFFAAKE